LVRDWQYLQTSDHFYYMSTKWFSDGSMHKYFNPFPSPYEAFINYMNVISDFIIRVKEKNGSPIEGTVREKGPRVTSGILRQEEPVKKIKSTRAGREKMAVERDKTEAQKTRAKASATANQPQPFHALNFSDIINLSDKKVKEIIKHIDIETVSAAMTGAEQEIRDKVEKNLGKRALKTYQTLIKQIRNISASEIKKSRLLIEKQIKSQSKQ
ncbi:MAG: FliG C-terminal domain-containing protein, partial [Syntrophothermus sp.]